MLAKRHVLVAKAGFSLTTAFHGIVLHSVVVAGISIAIEMKTEMQHAEKELATADRVGIADAKSVVGIIPSHCSTDPRDARKSWASLGSYVGDYDLAENG